MINHTRSDEAMILRHSVGWRICAHARGAARSRGFTPREVLLAAEDPVESWPQPYKGRGREMRVRGDVAVVVDAGTRTVVTVLWANESRWTDAQAAARRSA